MLKSLSNFAKSFGIRAVLMGIVIGLALPLEANAETVDRVNGGKEASAISSAVAMRDAIQRQFNIDARLEGIGSVRMTIHLKLDRDGQIVGVPDVEASGGSESTRKSITNAGVRAVRRAAPFTMLPKDKYDAWKEVILNFDTSALTQ
jgi:membrane protein involved in colicin uptake